MGGHFGELVRAEALITETLKLEESRFKQTLDRGLRLLNDESARIADGGALPGEVAFKLYDTYGFPLDLTQDVLRGEGKTVDTDGFDQAMERQRTEARKSWAGSGEAATDQLWFDLRERIGATEFLGYEAGSAEGSVMALIVDGAEVETAEAGSELMLIANQTPFYAESGGQVGDQGALFTPAGAEFVVTDTQKRAGDLWVHSGRLAKGTLTVGDVVDMRVDLVRRSKISANHSATHLLHEALRRRLGEHVTQKGSLVAPDRLRFDISQPRPLTADDVAEVQTEVNARVRDNDPVETRLMTPDDAIAAGAMALFGEKYGDTVRVVTMGQDGNRAYSMELCGGIHVDRTGDIGTFAIIGESAVAAGVRRIEALTGQAAVDHLAGQEVLLQSAAAALKTAPADLPARIASMVEDRRRLEREISDLRRRLASGEQSGGDAKTIDGISVASRLIEDVPAKELKPMADALKQQLGSGVVALVAVNDGKGSVVVGVTPDLTARLNAVDLVRAAASAMGGKGGGGRPDMAQAGGPDGSRAAAALEAVEAAIGAA